MTASTVCPAAPTPSDQPKVCCIYLYDGNGTPLEGQRQCIAIEADGSAGTITAAECTANVVYRTPTDIEVIVPRGFIRECCYDCNSDKRSLLVTPGGKILRAGGTLKMSPTSIFEKCCCPKDDCACTPVPDCEQVRCAHRPDLAGPVDRCSGRCTSYHYISDATVTPRTYTEDINQRQVDCQFKNNCCNDQDCEDTCRNGGRGLSAYTVPRKKSWERMPCTNCGVCCPYVYDREPDSPTFKKVTGYLRGLRFDPDDAPPITQETCEALSPIIASDPTSARVPYGLWHPGDYLDIDICNPLCCKTVTRGDRTAAECRHMGNINDTCPPCIGKCIDLTVENDPAQCSRIRCATQQECCGATGDNCRPACGRDAEYRWEPPTCPLDKKAGDSCGVCCPIIYDATTFVVTGYGPCDDSITTRAECEVLNYYDKPVGRWHPFSTCANGGPCNTKICCQELPARPGCRLRTAECARVPADTVCDCEGICTQLTGDNKGETRCKDKKTCCGDKGEKCRQGCNGEPAEFAWRNCGEPSCGVCCKNQQNGEVECNKTLTKEQCEAVNNGAPVGTWYPYGTCDDVPCAKTVNCCDDTAAPNCPPGIIRCLKLPAAACDNPCRSECYPIDAAGVKNGDSFCETKIDCCGPANQKCVAKPGICPNENTVPTHHWVASCTNPSICGVCCDTEAVGDERCTGINNETDCAAANHTWFAYGTCLDCDVRASACVEATCLINGNRVPTASCQPVPPNQTTCKGICKDKSTGFTTCKSRSECCGDDDAKCLAASCAAATTHEFSSSCIDGETCGVCCITVDNGNGPIPAPPQFDTGREECERLNNPPALRATWIPFGGGSQCQGTPCAKICPGNIVKCVNLQPPEVCPDPCLGACTAVNGTVSLKTKAACCVVDNVNLCEPTDARCPKPRWTAVCAENAAKCGATCKTIRDADNRIISSTCQPELNTYDKYLGAIAAAAAEGATLEWHDWDTCATVICQSKTCCKEICPGIFGCVPVSIDDPCKKCDGLCYDAIVNQTTGEHTIAPNAIPNCSSHADCCGIGNERCAAIPNCQNNNPKVFVPCCPNDNNSTCLCNTPPIAANTAVISQDLGPADNPTVISESCISRLFVTSPEVARFVYGELIDNFDAAELVPNLATGAPYYNTVVACPPVRAGIGIPAPPAENLTPAFNWKTCYPGILNNAPIYAYRRTRSTKKINPQANEPGQELYHQHYEQKVNFYICKDKKLVDITDLAIEKLPVKRCDTESKEYSQGCVLELISFEAGDYEALGLEQRPAAGLNMAPFGLPDAVYTGQGGTFCGFRNVCWIAYRCRSVFEIIKDKARGVSALNLTPLAAEAGWGPDGYGQPGSPRPVYRWEIGAQCIDCSSTTPLPPNEVVRSETEIADAFNYSMCRRVYNEYVGDAAPPGVGPPNGPNSTIPVSPQCCRVVKTTTKIEHNGCPQYSWQGLCQNSFNGGLIDENMTGCVENLAENPLP